MKICIDMGHTPKSPGASGYLDELSEDRAIGQRIIAELKARGHTVFNSTPGDWVPYPEEVNQRCAYANSNDIDLFVSLHLNAGGGTGTEVLYFAGDETGRKYASRISANVAAALGLPDRGAKANDWVGVICNTNCHAVLIEYCFVDRMEDYQAWCATSWDALVTATCNGIDGASYDAPNTAPSLAYEPDRSDAIAAGGDIRYAASTDPNGNDWLPDMVGWSDTGGSSDDYAGNGSPIYWLAMDCPKGYQVQTDNGWLPTVYKMDKGDLEYGTAGDGTPIHAVRVYDDSVQYAVANVGCGFLPFMVGRHDTGGSSDDFAGNGGTVAKIKARRI